MRGVPARKGADEGRDSSKNAPLSVEDVKAKIFDR